MSSSNEENVRKALDTLLCAPDDVLSTNRAQVLAAIISLSKRLKLPDDRCLDLLTTLERSAETSAELGHEDVQRVTHVSSKQQNIRLQHIFAVQAVRDKESLTRSLFALRSLGYEYDEFTRNQYGISRVQQLVDDYKTADKKNETSIPEYLKYKGYNDGIPERNAVRSATKILVFERLCKTPGISLLIQRGANSKFQRIPYVHLEGIAASLSSADGAFVRTGDVAKKVEGLVLNAQRHYDSTLQKRSERH
ncbi:hypothetical protein MauCBS54593_005308 [Microsporum audouinii]